MSNSLLLYTWVDGQGHQSFCLKSMHEYRIRPEICVCWEILKFGFGQCYSIWS